MTPTCIDLEERFGQRYRVTLEAGGATKPGTPADELPWLFEIRGRHGVVYPYGGEILAAASTTARIGSKLRALPFILDARGDVETVVRFHVDHAPAVFRILKPYRRRQVSEAERARLREIGRACRFQKCAPHGSESDFSDLETTERAGSGNA